MGVADGNSQRVRRVIRLRDSVQMQQDTGHLLHLFFHRLPISHYRRLNLQRRIFKDLYPLQPRCQEDHASGLRHVDGRFLVVVKVQPFHRHRLWAVLGQ